MGIARGELLHLRLFLEGIEVPVISASVTSSIGSAAQASIEVIPTDLLFDLLPRTLVHVYYLDYEEAKYSGGGANYRLLFSGELFSISMNKSAYGSRSATLHCLDLSNLWDTHYIYMNTLDGQEGTGLFSQQPLLFGAGDGTGTGLQFDSVINDPAVVIAALAGGRGSPETPGLRDKSGNLAGMLAIMEYMGGIQGKYRGVNDWVTVAEARLRLMDQVTMDSRDTADKLLKFSAFSQWIQGRVGRANALTSFREIMSIIMDMVYYDIVPIPSPKYVPGSSAVPAWGAVSIASDGLVNDMLPAFKALAEEFRVRLAHIVTMHNQANNENIAGPGSIFGWRPRRPGGKQDGWHTMGLAADISSSKPSGFNLFDFEKREGENAYDYRPKADHWYARVHNALANHASGPIHLTTIRQLLNDPKTPNVDSDDYLLYVEFKQFYTLWRRAWAETKHNKVVAEHGGAFPDNPYRSKLERISGAAYGGLEEKVWTSMGHGSDPVHLYVFRVLAEAQQANADYLKAQGETISLDLSNVPTMKVGEPRERLLTQMLRPHVWFVSPPSCNVIFPEELSSFGMNRHFMRETSRMQLAVFNNMVGEDPMLRVNFFAPLFDDKKAKEKNLITEEESQTIKQGGTVYDHEKFSGLVPRYMKMSDAAHWGVGADSGGNASEAAATLSTYGEEAAHFNLFDTRYQARTGTATSRFLPRLVCGFPLVVMDSVTQRNVPGQRPAAYLGLVTSLSHMVSQGGGQTSVTLTHLRSYRGGVNIDDLLAGHVLQIQRDGRKETREFSLDTFGDLKPPKEDFTKAMELLKFFTDEVSQVIDLAAVPRCLLPRGKHPSKITVIYGEKVAAFKLPKVSSSLPYQKMLSGADWSSPVVPDTVSDLEHVQLNYKNLDIRYRNSRGVTVVNPAVLHVTTGYGTATATEVPARIADGVSFYQDAAGKYVVVEEGEGSAATVRSFQLLLEYSSTKVEPFEEAIRPEWISESFTNENIGKFYQDTIGCGALVDLQLTAPNEDPSVAGAVEWISHEYAVTSGEGREAGGFIYAVTRRPVATLAQVSGKFHAEACGSKEGFSGLPGLTVPLYPFRSHDYDRGSRRISSDLDPRKERYDRVAAYVNEILAHRGLRG